MPKSVRDTLGLQQGDQVLFRIAGGSVVLSRTPDLSSLAGSVDVPLSRRGTPWDDIRRDVRRSRPRST